MERFLSYRLLSTLIPIAAGISVAACGASVGDDAASVSALAGASESDATVSAQSYKNGASINPGVVDVDTVQQALTALTGNVDGSVIGFKAGVASGNGVAAEGGNPATAAQSVSVPCAAGGGANVDGYMNMAHAPVAIDVNVAVAFNGCATRTGTMIDGNIDFSQMLVSESDASTEFQVETTYEGDINLSGDINVSCPVDLNVLVDKTGRAIEVQGLFCNQDAGNLSMQLQPLWQSH